MERITILKDYGNELFLIAVSGRCDWTVEAQIRLAKKRTRNDHVEYEPFPMNVEIETALHSLGLTNLCTDRAPSSTEPS